MVGKIYCDHCGAEAHRVYTKEFVGKLLNFCCNGCLGVYEMMREEGLNQEQKPDEKTSFNNKG